MLLDRLINHPIRHVTGIRHYTSMSFIFICLKLRIDWLYNQYSLRKIQFIEETINVRYFWISRLIDFYITLYMCLAL